MRKLKWGLIGCGDIARRRVAPALRDLDKCDFVAVSRAQVDLAESFGREFGARKWYATWWDLINDEEIEAVYIATPVYLHARQAITAIKAEKHVLCEKPMAMNVQECDAMLDHARLYDVRLGISCYRHFYPVVLRMKELIATGVIGKLVMAQINAFELFNPDPDHPRYWVMKKEEAGGGPMFDIGCHRIEVLLNVIGAISNTSGITSNILFDREVEDTGTACFQFENGARGILTVTHATYERRDSIDIYGSEGSLHVPLLNTGDLKIITSKGERVESHPPHTNLHLPLIEDFTEAVLEGREPGVPGLVGREVAKILEDIYRS